MADEINQRDASSEPAASVPAIAAAAGQSGQFDRADWLSFAVTAILALAVYLFTLAPDVTLGYDGFFATAANYAGVPIPPGYPVWTIYSWLFTRLLPFSNIAWRVSVGSALAAALASGLVALIVSCGGKHLLEDSSGAARLTSEERKLSRTVCGCVAGLALGLSSTVWGKALIADIWTFSLLLFTAVLCLALRWTMQPEARRFLYIGFLLLGLLLTGSQEMLVALPGLVFMAVLGDRNLGRDLALFALPPAAFLSAWNTFGVWIIFPHVWNPPMLIAFATVAALGPVLVFVPRRIRAQPPKPEGPPPSTPEMGITSGNKADVTVVQRRIGSTWRAALLCLIFYILGLSLSLYLPVASMTTPPMNWGYPRTVEGFFHVISRGQFDRANPTADFGEYAGQLWMFLKMTGHDLGWPYLFLAVVPLCKILRIDRTMRKWLIALVMMFVCTCPVLVAELNPGYDRTSQDLTAFYFIPSFAVLSVLAGLGLVICIRVVPMRNLNSPEG